KATRDATVAGLVQDDSGKAVAGATVSVVGGESGETSATGSFLLKTNAAAGQVVRLHAEKRGYATVDQDHPAGREPVTIILRAERPRR
ncbi:MAG TPA: carboxypeptidase-like regulatory domain-containing protein, partial [Vicinamibacterales bacterium]|nr:carboxypeptidase-like regulatory domain-containing protein [Vicinamibacterales bacterium]